jgi:hypothetical protein
VCYAAKAFFPAGPVSIASRIPTANDSRLEQLNRGTSQSMTERMASCVRAYALGFFYMLFCTATPARAQLAPRSLSDPATGERYHIEAAGALWNPTPDFVIKSESLGIIGSQIDAVADLGIAKKRVNEFRLVLRPGTKHKFKLDRIPARYEASAILTRSIVFNGQLFTIGLPVTTTFDWTTIRLGYEYDFVYRDRGFAGLILDVKATDIQAEITAPFVGTEFARARAPIPALGGIGRVYVAPNISITFELNGIKIPDSLNEDYRFKYVDVDLYGTVNINNYVGAQFGYRSLDTLYKIKGDEGTLKLKGLYFGGVVRY